MIRNFINLIERNKEKTIVTVFILFCLSVTIFIAYAPNSVIRSLNDTPVRYENGIEIREINNQEMIILIDKNNNPTYVTPLQNNTVIIYKTNYITNFITLEQ